MAAAADEPEAPTKELDVACGLENVPVTAWPPGAAPEPFQYTAGPVAGPGADADPTQLALPGCRCRRAACRPGPCACQPRGRHYEEGARLALLLAAPAPRAPPVFECNALCGCADACGNRVVQRGLQLRLQVFRTERKGWGLRTLERVPRGRFVCEYAGEVLGAAEARRRARAQTAGDRNYILAVREHAGGGRVWETFVDPARTGNVGRFLNHSCEPNLLMVPVRAHSTVPRLALFAARDILPEEELCYDYSGRFLNPSDREDQEPLDDATPRKPCYCGAPACAGRLPYDGSLYRAPEDGEDGDAGGAPAGPSAAE